MSDFKARNMLHGADYNYEQWLDYPHILDKDFEWMGLAQCNVMSVGIFSWAQLEPAEGEFRFEWLDELMDRLAANEIRVILATPSAAKPAWLSQKYPETRIVDALGHRQPHRMRQNHCPSSPIYREKVRQINTLLATRYAEHPALFLWHVSNEYGNHDCRCDLCLTAFRNWLQIRYGSLDALNKAWWTSFWSHRYTDWSQIEPVDPSIHSLMLDWRRFVSSQVLDFYLEETKPLRRITPQVPITTNFMRPDVGLDYWDFAPHLDVISWDSYPRWHSEPDERRVAVETAFFHDLHRTYKQRPFLLMESTPSATNWQGISRPKRPEFHKLAALQTIAHGSNSVQYFQWRQSRGGEEKFHGAVVNLTGEEKSRTFEEVAAVGKLLAQLKPVVGSLNVGQVALIYDFQNEWALNLAQLPRSVDKNYQERCMAHYRPFWQQGITVDIINSTFPDLSGYKLLIVPMLYMVQEGVAERLSDFVRTGGTIVATYLTGIVNSSDLVFLDGAPGPLKDVLGIRIEESDVLLEHNMQSIQPEALTLAKSNYSVKQYADIVHLQGAETLAVYGQDFYAGRPALTVNQWGEGFAYYLAARCDHAFLADFYAWLGEQLGLTKAIAQPLPTGVTAQVRTNKAERYIFVLNFESTSQGVEIDAPGTVDALSGQPVSGVTTLDGYGYRILKQPLV